MRPSINLIFRLDDYSALSNTQFEITLLCLLEKYNIPTTFGVVPFVYPDEWNPSPQDEYPLPDEKINLLKPYIEKGLVEIALHGYHHHTHERRLNGHIPGEFYGISFDEQRSKIHKGKEFLEQAFSCRVTTFIPPWNTYDSATLGALEENGFTCLSMGPRFGPVSGNDHLAYIPALCKLSDAHRVIAAVQASQLDSAWVVVWFHEYDFVEVAPHRSQDKLTYELLEDLFSWVASQSNVVTLTLGQVGLQKNEFNRKRYQLAGILKKHIHITPPFLRSVQKIPSYYPGTNWLSKQFIRWLLGITSYYLVIMFAGVFIILVFGQIVEKEMLWLATVVLSGLLAGLMFFIFKRRKVFYRTLSLGVFLAGVGVGGLLNALRF